MNPDKTDWENGKCPVCDKVYHRYNNTVRMHIYHLAKGEIWRKSLGEDEDTPHFDFYVENTIQTKSPKRAWTL